MKYGSRTSAGDASSATVLSKLRKVLSESLYRSAITGRSTVQTIASKPAAAA